MQTPDTLSQRIQLFRQYLNSIPENERLDAIDRELDQTLEHLRNLQNPDTQTRGDNAK